MIALRAALSLSNDFLADPRSKDGRFRPGHHADKSLSIHLCNKMGLLFRKCNAFEIARSLFLFLPICCY